MRKALPRHAAERALQEWGSINEAAAQLGVSRWTVRRALARGQEIVSSDVETVEELIARREKLFLAKKTAVDANYEKVVSLPSMLPIGILHMGDPRVDVDAAYDARVRLRFPRGADVRIWARHDFPGRSMWAKSHGQARAAQLGGYPADVLISGHRHCWESRTTERPDGSVYHAIQVGAYKVIDSYSDQLGYVTPRYGSACLTVIDPLSPPPGRVMVFWDVAAGATYLSHLRASRK